VTSAGNAHSGDAGRAGRTGRERPAGWAAPCPFRPLVPWTRRRHAGTSFDDLTGVSLPGLSANPLAVEPWWDDRPLRLWVARRLYDYSHLKHEKGPCVRPWVLEGEEIGRGPDNEPLVRCDRPVAWIAPGIIAEARRVADEQNAQCGPLRRPAAG
jgi:hypothetical protein